MDNKPTPGVFLNRLYIHRKNKLGRELFMGYNGELSRTKPDYMRFREDGSYTGYDNIGILIGKEPTKT